MEPHGHSGQPERIGHGVGFRYETWDSGTERASVVANHLLTISGRAFHRRRADRRSRRSPQPDTSPGLGRLLSWRGLPFFHSAFSRSLSPREQTWCRFGLCARAALFIDPGPRGSGWLSSASQCLYSATTLSVLPPKRSEVALGTGAGAPRYGRPALNLLIKGIRVECVPDL
jgi:hypothetical protein